MSSSCVNSLSTPSRTTPGYDAEAKQVVYEDSEDVPAENASLAVEWNARVRPYYASGNAHTECTVQVEDTRSRIEDLLAGVKRRMHLVQDQAVARERQMAEAMQVRETVTVLLQFVTEQNDRDRWTISALRSMQSQHASAMSSMAYCTTCPRRKTMGRNPERMALPTITPTASNSRPYCCLTYFHYNLFEPGYLQRSSTVSDVSHASAHVEVC